MKFASADLLDNVVTSYDQTKTTITGNTFLKTIDGKQALGPSINKFLDVQNDSGIALAANNLYMTENGRIFVLSTEAVVASIICYELNYSTGVYSYIGRLQIQMPDTAATTTTYRALKVIDTGTTGWKIFIATTGSVLINGGLLLVNKVDKADFVPVGFATLPFATGNDQKAVYKLNDPSAMGVLSAFTAAAGAVLDKSNNKIYVHNGVAATHQYFVFNTNTAPTYPTNSVTGLALTDVISDSGHPYSDNDPIVFTSITGGAGIVVGTVYFVRNSVPGTSYQISATTGGAALNFTTDITAGSVGRAFGETGSNFSFKTGNLPALSGTLLLTDSEDYALPQHTANSGSGCAFFCTTTTMYLGKLSDLSAGVTSWPSLLTANMQGTTNEIVTSNATQATWSNSLDKAIVCFGFTFIMKKFVNNLIDKTFGGTSNKYLEGFNYEAIELQPNTAITGMDLESGWLGITNTSTGQRGVILADIRSDSLFEYSSIITKVIDIPNSVLKFVKTLEALFEYTGTLSICYRTSGFGSASGGWIKIDSSSDLTSVASGSQIQFLIHFDTVGLDTSIPAQVCEVLVGYESLLENSENWELSVDDSDNGNPSRSAFRLKKAYSSSVPDLRYMAYDLTDVLVVDHNTTANTARFEYSTDDGVSWNNLGTIPNTVGTMVRYTFSTPPGVDIRPSIKEL